MITQLIKGILKFFHIHRKTSITIDYGVDDAGHWYTYQCRCSKNITVNNR